MKNFELNAHMKSGQRTNLHQELESLLRSAVPTGDVAYRAAEIAFVLAQMSGRFIECEYGFVNFLKHLECSPELRSDLMRDLVPLWGKISNLQERYKEKECEATIRECARQDAPDNVNVPPSLIPLVTKLLSSAAGGIMVDIGCGYGLVLARALEEDADLHGEGIDINQRSANFSEMVISPLKPRGDVYCKSVFDFMVDRIGKYDKVFCFPPIGIRMDRDWEAFRQLLPGGFPHVGTGCSSELVFALTTIAAMKETGRAVVILPEIALCNKKNGAVAVREYLLNSGYLDSVIMLPERTLEQMQIGMSLLVFKKQADRSHVVMIDASGLGKKSRRFNVLLAEDVEKIIKAVEDGSCNSEKWTLDHCKAVSYDEIRRSGYSFSVCHYIKKIAASSKPSSREKQNRISPLIGAISGYALVEKILNYYGNEGVAKLLESVDSKETEFLELKTSYLLSEEDKKDDERQENLNWDIALALIAIANTAGGALIIGVEQDNRRLCPVEVKEDKEAFLRMKICQVLLPDQRVWTVYKKNGKDKNGKYVYVKERWMADGLPRFEPCLYPYCDGENSGDVVVILVKPQPRGQYITLENINLGTKRLVQREKGIGKVVSYYDSAKFRALDNERDIERGWYLTLLRKMVPDLNASPIGRSSGVYRLKSAEGYDGKDIEDPLVRQTEGHRLCCDFKPGDRIDKYMVEERIGSGGMGVVYRVRHVTLGGEYALKAFKMESEDSSMAKDRFRAEAQVLMKLDHPGLPKVHDLGFDEEAECYYLVQDLIVGEDGKPHELGGYAVNSEAAAAQNLVHISSEKALKWLRQVCEIANYLHGKGIVHRDITLKNLLIDVDGNVKLTDFGIVKVMAPEIREMIKCHVTMTFTQTPSGDKGFLGTLRYLPPEVREKRKADIKPEATDIWAIGVSFFKVLTGEWFGSQQFADYDWNGSIWGMLLKGMLKVDSGKRMSCADALTLLDANKGTLSPLDRTTSVDPRANFVGRERITQTIIDSLSNSRSVSLCGLGRIGKTSLGMNVFARIKAESPHLRTGCVNMVMFCTQSELWRAILEIILSDSSCLKEWPADNSESYFRFRRILQNERTQTGKPLGVLMLDDFDVVSRYDQSGVIIDRIREIACDQDKYGLSFLFVSRRSLERIQKKCSGSNLFGICDNQSLLPFSREELKELCELVFPVSEGLLEILFHLTGGIPYLAATLLNKLIQSGKEMLTEINEQMIKDLSSMARLDIYKYFNDLRTFLEGENLWQSLCREFISPKVEAPDLQDIAELTRYGLITDWNESGCLSDSLCSYINKTFHHMSMWEPLSNFERALRVEVKKTLVALYGENWIKEAPSRKSYYSRLFLKLDALRIKEQAFSTIGPEEDLLEYSNPGTLKDIVMTEWDAFSTLFCMTKSDFAKHMDAICLLRNSANHYRRAELISRTVKFRAQEAIKILSQRLFRTED